MDIKRIVLALLLILLGCSASAQKFNATYTYDANGNRITATIIFLSTKETETLIETEAEAEIKTEIETEAEALENITVDTELNLSLNIYPNPTKGVVLIEIINATSEQLNAVGNSLRVWDVQSKLIMDISRIEISNTINLSNVPNGIYLVNLQLAGKPNYLKVIKN